MGTRLWIFGAGGHGCVVADAATASALWDSVCFVDDGPRVRSPLETLPVLSTKQALSQCLPAQSWIIAIGDNHVRERKFLELKALGFIFATIVQSTACVSRFSILEDGIAVMPNVVVNAHAVVGRNTILNTGVIVEHDCVVGQSCHLSPGSILSGGVTVGRRTWVGAGAVVKEGLTIGSDVIIGAGSVVLKDVESGMKVAGVPAKNIGRKIC